jgi:hypothetical protein
VRISGVTYRHPLANITNGAGAAGGGGAGPTGKSYDFDGVDDYVLANGAASAIDFNSTAHTVSVWAKVPPTGVALSALWAFTNSAASSSRYWLAITAAGAVNLYGWSNSAGVYVFGGAGGVVVGSGLDDDAWHNIVVTYDGATALKIYIDGGAPSTVVVGAGTLTSDTFSFGARRVSGVTSFPADCLIHQASVFTVALSDSDVADLYNNNRPIDETTLTRAPTNYYRFGNGDTLFPTLKDYGPGGADGTAVNMAPTAIVDDYPQGMSYLFDGVSDYIQADAVVASTGTFDWQSDAQSVSVWFRTSNTAAQALWSFGHSSNTGWYYLQVEGGASPKVKLLGQYNTAALFGRADATSSPNGATGSFWVLSTDPGGIDPSDGEWHHVVATFQGAASTAQAVKLYIDGNYVGFSQSRSSSFNASDFSIAVLREDGASNLSEYFAGNISQVSMYTSELTAADVTALYAGGSMPDPRSLSTAPQHLFRFGAGDGSFPTLVDYGSTPQNGTAVNMTSADVKGDSPT